jgi:hypothetical protein
MAMEKAPREGSIEEQSWKDDAPMKARKEAIQSIMCFKCELGAFWTDGHDHECPNFKENKKTNNKENRLFNAAGARRTGNSVDLVPEMRHGGVLDGRT